MVLDELIDEQPRYIRKLYKDPMTEEGEWTLVYLQPMDANALRGLDNLTLTLTGARDLEANSENEEDKRAGLTRDPSSVFAIKDQQITGVRSKSDREGLTIREESRIYSDWLFSALPKPKQDEEGGLLDRLIEREN